MFGRQVILFLQKEIIKNHVVKTGKSFSWNANKYYLQNHNYSRNKLCSVIKLFLSLILGKNICKINKLHKNQIYYLFARNHNDLKCKHVNQITKLVDPRFSKPQVLGLNLCFKNLNIDIG